MYWLIEPHVDDAYLSLHEHITGPWRDIPKTIVTMYGRDIIDEGRYYAHATGCDYRWWGLSESGWREHELPPPTFLHDTCRPGDTVVLPIGIRQPVHVLLGQSTIPDEVRALWYLDAKYIQQVARQEVLDKTSGLIVESILVASSDKHHYKNIFVSQAHRFLLAPDLYPPTVEIVLRKP